jgi:hypothetical protein
MGGPMSVNDEDQLPWLAPEKRFIRAAINSGKPESYKSINQLMGDILSFLLRSDG